jgi:hypothetical protein
MGIDASPFGQENVMIRPRRRTVAALLPMALVPITLALPAPAYAAGPSAAAHFTIGRDGALYTWVIDVAAPPSPLVRVTAPGSAPPGGGVAAARMPDGSPVAFFIAGNGTLTAVRATAGGWTSIPNGPPNIAGPGGNLAAASTSSGVRTFLVGPSGAIMSATVDASGAVSAPMAISAAGIAPPGAPIAAATAVNGQPVATVVGNQGRPVTILPANGSWVSLPSGPPNIASPAAPVASARYGSGVDGFFAGRNGQLYLVFATPGGPVPGEPLPIAPLPFPGAAIAAVQMASGAELVTYIDADGAFTAVVGGGSEWAGPYWLSEPGLAPVGGTLAASATGDTAAAANIAGEDEVCGTKWSTKWTPPKPHSGPPHSWFGTSFTAGFANGGAGVRGGGIAGA